MNSVIQFSGGRTSAFLLRYLLDLHGGKLPPQWLICFENTGKEREETLEFVEEVSQRWSVPITWLEYDDYFDEAEYEKEDGTYRLRKNRPPTFRIVDFKTASRKGEPFQKMLNFYACFRAIVKDLGPILPNPTARICTAHLKIKVMYAYTRSLGWDDMTTYVGIRKDEERRLYNMRASIPEFENVEAPLVDIGVTKDDVMEFWNEQPFDLRLDPNSDEGNCDLCFLKATGKLIRIMQKDRSLEEWWKAAEIRYKGTFSNKKPSFHQLAEWIDNNDPKLQKYIKNYADQTLDCFCGD